ncbi:MAG: radical SAM protein [Desulfobacterales bacterium]|nr:radical SAM protein [Desulfobacterales bacterium]
MTVNVATDKMLIQSTPLHYNIELTPYCNNLCPGCGGVSKEQFGKPLSASQFQNVLNKISSHAVHLRISGGEPTLHPEFSQIAEAIDNSGISFVIFTNARWPDPKKLIKSLCNMPHCKGMLISLHGATPEIHESFTRVNGSFKETVNNINQAVKAGLSVATSTIITNTNYHYAKEIISFSKKIGAERAVFSRYIPVRSNSPTTSENQLKEAIKSIEEMRCNGYQAEFSVCIPQCFASSSVGCLSGITYCIIDPWGNIRPCTHVPITCGNLLEKTIEEIWYSPEMQDWRNLIPAQCYDCLEISKCRGGCRAAAILNNLEKDPLMSKPVSEKPQEPPDELVLYENAYPRSHFTIRPEPFGYILLQGNTVIPVSHSAKPIIDILNGKSTLREIEELFGQQALDFIGHLYQKGLVELRQDIF